MRTLASRFASAQRVTDRSVESRTANLLDDPAVGGIVVSSRDVTDRVHLEEALTRRAFDDALTGLANRSLFVRNCATRRRRKRRRGSPTLEVAAKYWVP